VRTHGWNYQIYQSFRLDSRNDDGHAFLASRGKSVYHDVVKKQITLKKNEERRILAGHQWVFSNEIKAIQGAPDNGDVVELLRHDGRFLGVGFFHSASLIAFRLLSSEREEISFAFFERRISAALALRTKLSPGEESFRLAHGESDFLPGLIIDKFNEYLVVQALSAGMDRRMTLIGDVLESLFHPKAIVARNESPLRSLEQLPMQKSVLRGSLDQTIVNEAGVKFKLDLLEGHKTGAFLDQRTNRGAARRYCADASVLDCFCNEGGFSLHARAAGANSVLGIDSSEPAIGRAGVNTKINQMTDVTFECSDAFETLKVLRSKKRRFDVVILDPPSFTRNKRTTATALRAYREINGLAASLITPGGFLITSSCSHHIGEEEFFSAVERSILKSGRKGQLLESAGAAPDHPTLISMPETGYLKFGVFAVS
jgi:23S rRNA (cytosine1962-C5)-methyltransferase